MEINKFLELFGKVACKYSIEQMDIDNDGSITEKELETLLNSKTETDEEVKADLTTSIISETEKTESSEINENENSGNSQKVLNYDNIKKAWMDYYTELKSGEWEEKAKQDAKDLRGNNPGEPWTEKACYNLYKIPAYDGAVQSAEKGFDINGDGKFDIEDYKAFNTHVDLDGDGKISAKEHKFLEDVKARMDLALSVTAYKNACSTNDIDTVIESLEVLDENRMERFKEKALEELYEWEAYSYEKGIVRYKQSDDDILGRGAGHKLEPYIPLKQAMKDGLLTTDIMTTPIGELKESLLNCMDYYSPANQYLRYINKYNHSKEKLEEILNKINSASSSVQSQLAEVKKAVEEKLKKLS